MNPDSRRWLRRVVAILLVAVPVALGACGQAARPAVVVYTSVDQVYAEPVLQRFAQKTGIRVLPVYDVEATKTTGLVNRLLAEKARPQADVFWNGEFAQTLLLQDEGVLAPYRSPAAADLPAPYVDPEGYWAAVGGRARVLLVNTQQVAPADYPRSLTDLLEAGRPGEQIGIANPLFGTTATQAAALYAAWGPERALAFYAQLRARGVRILDGNSVVRDQVAAGQLAMGLTDTDDACGALARGAPVALVFLDQEEGGLGTLVIPGTVALVAGAPHPRPARALIDYLLSAEVEQDLIAGGWSQIPLRAAGAMPDCLAGAAIRGQAVSLAAIRAQMLPARRDLSEVFIR